MPDVSSEWSPDLPWLRFTSLLSDAPIDILGLMSERLCRALSETGVQDLATSGNHATMQLAARGLGLSFLKDISNPLKLSAVLRSIMPEIIPGEHLLRSQIFFKGSDIATRDVLSLFFYQLSNKAISINERSNELLVDIISRSGLVGLNHPLLAEPTVRSFLEEVGLAALCCCGSEIVTWILDLGINLAAISHHHPLVVVASRLGHKTGSSDSCAFHGACYHSEQVSYHDGKATITALLAQAVSPDAECCHEHGTPLETAIRYDLLETVKVFVEHGRKTHGWSYLRELDFSRLLLSPSWDTPLATQSAMLDYLQTLFEEAFQPPISPFAALLSADGLIKAGLYGGQALLNILYAKGANFNCKNPRGEHPLGVVVASRKKTRRRAMPWGSSEESQRCNLLVALGAAVEYSPTRGDGQGTFPSAIHIASLLDDTDALAAFLGNGPCRHTPASFYVDGYWLYGLELVAREEEPQARSPLDWSLWRTSHRCAILLLKAGCPVQGHELILLMSSIRTRDHYPEMVELAHVLINRDIDLNLQTISGKTALDIAISKEQFEIANVLILGGATTNIAIPRYTSNALDNRGWLDHLTRHILPDIENWAEDDLNKTLDDWCRLYSCESITSQNSRLGDVRKHLSFRKPTHLTIFKFVIERYRHAYSSVALLECLNRMDELAEEEEGWTLSLQMIHELLKRRRPEFITPKVELFALDMLMNTILYQSMSADMLDVLGVLLQQDPGLGRIDSDPWENPLCRPALWGVGRFPKRTMESYKPIREMLLGSGFTVNTAVGLTAIAQGCSTDELKKIMDHGFNPRKRYRWSNTALQLAVINDDLDMVRYLLDHDVNVNGRPRWGELPRARDVAYMHTLGALWSFNRRTAFQYAVENNSWECTQLLCDYGADVNAPPARRAGATALQLAAMKGHIGLVRWLISENADILAPGAAVFGMTAIEGAAAFGRLDIVGLLFEYGNFFDGEGRSQCIRAVGYARKKKYEALRSYMEVHIAWSKEDERVLAREDLLELVDITDKGRFEKDDHQGCVYETESVDEGMDEPECCRDVDAPMDSSGSEDGEAVYSDQSVSENEDIRPTEHMPNSYGEGASTSYGGENAPWLSGEDGNVFSDNHDLGSVDLGILPDSYAGLVIPDAPGAVIGELLGNEGWLNEPIAPALHSEWTDPYNQGGWMAPNEDISGNQLDFSQFL